VTDSNSAGAEDFLVLLFILQRLIYIVAAINELHQVLLNPCVKMTARVFLTRFLFFRLCWVI